MLSCKQATRLVSQKLDRELPFWQRLSLRIHVLMCRGCSRYTYQVEALDEAVSGHYRGDSPAQQPEQLPDDALERIKASLRRSNPNADFHRTE